MKKYFALLSFTCILAFGLSNCKLTDNATSAPSAAFFVVHASPGTPNIDAVLNGGIVAQNLAYGHDSGYFFVPSATYDFKIAAPSGSTTYVADANISFDAGKYYSIFAIDSFSKIKIAAVPDVLSIPGTDSANVRFLQFSPDAPYLSATFKNTATTDSLSYSGRSFNDQSSSSAYTAFKTIKAGTYTLNLSLPGSGTAFKSFSNIVFTNGRSYTVYLKGLYSSTTTQALDTGIVRNTQ